MRAKLLLSPTGAPQHVFLKIHTYKQNRGMKGVGGGERGNPADKTSERERAEG